MQFIFWEVMIQINYCFIGGFLEHLKYNADFYDFSLLTDIMKNENANLVLIR